MDGPERMLDQTGSSFERALLEEGRRYRVPAELRADTLAALGLAVTAGAAISGALAWLATKTWTTKLLLALSGLTLVAAIPVSYVFLQEEKMSALASVPTPPLAPRPMAEEATPAVATETSSPARVVEPTTIKPASPPRTAGASSGYALRAELAALDAVRSTLANDDALGALSFLAAYFRTFPRGRLHLEAEVLRIDALAKAGRLDAAKRHAREFLKRHANSVLAARVQPYAQR